MATPISLRILIDEEKNKVLFAQGGKDFIDLLLSFLTFPLATIARLVSTESNMQKVSFGSISTLYESVANLEEHQFWTPACKQMLRQPKNSMEDYYQNLKININVAQETHYYVCEDWYCSRENSGGLLTTFSNLKCSCGKLMSREIYLSDNETIHDFHGFVADAVTFCISDDLCVKPDSFQNFICQPMNLLGLEDFNAIKFITVDITHKEILDLLKLSLTSECPLTDMFLLKKQSFENTQLNCVLDSDNGIVEENDGKKIEVKILLRKSNNKILFALGDADFADFITSDLKEKLVNPKLAHQFKLKNSLLSFEEVPHVDIFCVTRYNRKKTGFHGYLTALEEPLISNKELSVPLSYLEPQSSIGEVYGEGGCKGFMKSPALYMVTDDLVVTPSTSVSVLAFLSNLGIPSSDLEERMVTIGKLEGLSILKASLMSSSALTNGLRPFLKVKAENTSRNGLGPFLKVKDEKTSN